MMNVESGSVAPVGDDEALQALWVGQSIARWLSRDELRMLHWYLSTCIKSPIGVVAPAALRSKRLSALAQWALEESKKGEI